MNATPFAPTDPPHQGPPAQRDPLQVSAVRSLPALPAAVLELLTMLRREDVEITDLAAKISHDQALCAKTLRLANSSFYGMPRHVISVAEAATVLGLRTVRTVVTAAALTGSVKPPVCEGFDFTAFWRHALSTAVAAKLVADASGADAEAAFTAGLLHDIGQLVLASNFPERYARVLALGALTESELRLAEQAMLDSDHLAVGALVAEHWRFPTLIVEAIANHHSMQTATATSALVRIVRAANQLIQAIELGATAAAVPPASPDDAWAGTGLSANDWTRILSETEMQTQTICAALLN